MTQAKDIQLVNIERLQPHPDNPRLVIREDVVDSIVAQIKGDGEFSPMHALIARRVNGHFEIISGHHRVEAAKRVGIKQVPCWISEMSDADAFMQLALSNAQGELSPLEIGMHALKAVPLSIGGFRKKGGLSEYARRLGKDAGNLSRYRDAAEVFLSLVNPCNDTRVLDKAQHLAAIHSADRRLWWRLVEALLKKEWSVTDTEHWVKKVNEFNIPDKWAEIFLYYVPVVERFLDTHEFSPSTVKKLCELADATEALIEAHIPEGDSERSAQIEGFHKWLREGIGKESWDARQISKYQRELLAALEASAQKNSEMWNLGDFHEHIDKLQDGSVALLFTDPPYGVDFQSDYRLDRRKERKHARIANDGSQEAMAALGDALTMAYPKLIDNAHVLVFCHWSNEPEIRAVVERSGYQIRNSLIWVKNTTGMGDPSTTFSPQHERIIYAVKGSPTLLKRASDVQVCDRMSSERHPTEKPVDLLQTYIEATTVEGELVADPFGGVASTLVAAKQLGRMYWGCEVDAEYHRVGAERLLGDE